MPSDLAGTMRALGVCRSAMVEVLRTVKPMGPAYHAASMVMSAIDGFATFLSGQRYYFSSGGSSPTGLAREATWLADKEDPPCP